MDKIKARQSSPKSHAIIMMTFLIAIVSFDDLFNLSINTHLCTYIQDQYFFIHEALAEALLCGNTEVNLTTLGGYVTELGTVVPGNQHDTTHIEIQFKVRLCVCVQGHYPVCVFAEAGH